MVNVTARIKLKGKKFEVSVDCDKALALRKGKSPVAGALVVDTIFSDLRKGIRASENELKDVFGTTDVNEIAKKIITQGEVQLPVEYKEKAREAKEKQIIDFIVSNCTDPKGIPHTPKRIEEALKQSKVRIYEDKSVEEQISSIISELQKILPLKIETKRILVMIPAAYIGKAYGLIHDYIVKEEWQSDGSLSCVLNLPVAAQISFFDKLNSTTHGAATTQEIKER